MMRWPNEVNATATVSVLSPKPNNLAADQRKKPHAPTENVTKTNEANANVGNGTVNVGNGTVIVVNATERNADGEMETLGNAGLEMTNYANVDRATTILTESETR